MRLPKATQQITPIEKPTVSIDIFSPNKTAEAVIVKKVWKSCSCPTWAMPKVLENKGFLGSLAANNSARCSAKQIDRLLHQIRSFAI